MMVKNNPLVQYLLTLKHARKTDLVAGVINNMDAVALFIHAQGATDPATLKEFSKAWRGDDVLKYCFGPHNGCIATDYLGDKILCGSFGPCSGAPRAGTQLWYRLVPAPIKERKLLHKLTKRGEERVKVLQFIAAIAGKLHPDHIQRT